MYKELLQIIEGNRVPPSSELIVPLLKMADDARDRFEELPKEDKERINRERRAANERRRIDDSVNRGRCPTCGHRLTRGKKNKNNEYKRIWTCGHCEWSIYR